MSDSESDTTLEEPKEEPILKEKKARAPRTQAHKEKVAEAAKKAQVANMEKALARKEEELLKKKAALELKKSNMKQEPKEEPKEEPKQRKIKKVYISEDSSSEDEIIYVAPKKKKTTILKEKPVEKPNDKPCSMIFKFI